MENNQTIFFSASDLIKKSASQIKYLRDKAERYVSNRMLLGEAFQKKVIKQKNADADEMRGIYQQDNIIIFFSNDMIKDGKVVEIKMVNDEKDCPLWYFKSSILQTAFYKALLMKSNGILSTPTFRIKEGYNKKTIKINPNTKYNLIFGKEEYSIEVTNKEKIVNFFINKAKVSLLSYNDTKLYDFKYKFKEYDNLKDSFIFTKINKNSNEVKEVDDFIKKTLTLYRMSN